MPSSPVSKQRAADIRELGEIREEEREEVRKAKLDKIYARHNDRVKAEAEQTIRLMKRRAKLEFSAAGGDPDDFESEWPEMKKALIRNRIKDSLALPQPSLVGDF